MRILILHNPGAGGGNLDADALVGAFGRAGHAADYRSLKEEGDFTEAAERAEVVVVAGGDGTVGKVVRRLGGCWPRLAILPLGTANNIARAIGAEVELDAVAEGLAGWRERAFNIGLVEGPWQRRLFLESVGVGALAEMVAAGNARDHDGEAKRRFGEEAPPRFLREAPPRDWRATADGTALPGDLLFIEVLNVPIAGSGFRLARGEWRVGDGMLDVVTLREAGRERLAGWAETDRSSVPEAIDRMPARRVELDWTGGALRIDDDCPEHPGGTVRLAVTLAEERLRVLVPPGTED
jgi:diacylglycerol kinase (ATP)